MFVTQLTPSYLRDLHWCDVEPVIDISRELSWTCSSRLGRISAVGYQPGGKAMRERIVSPVGSPVGKVFSTSCSLHCVGHNGVMTSASCPSCPAKIRLKSTVTGTCSPHTFSRTQKACCRLISDLPHLANDLREISTCMWPRRCFSGVCGEVTYNRARSSRRSIKHRGAPVTVVVFVLLMESCEDEMTFYPVRPAMNSHAVLTRFIAEVLIPMSAWSFLAGLAGFQFSGRVY